MARKSSRRTGAKTRTNRSGKSRTTRKASTASELTTLAYKMGQVQRGLQNPDSKISTSFERGKTKPEKRKKQSLF